MTTLSESDILFANKPAGISTHSPGPGRDGFVEFLQRERRCKLFVVHRLDKMTSGAMVFARSPDAAALMTELFSQRKVQKTYLLVTDRPVASTSFKVQSHIEKKNGVFVSHGDAEVNSETAFEHLQTQGRFSLWQATPLSGKPHQIRLHASSKGIPILGDHEHGGSAFPTLMLHSSQLKFTSFVHSSKMPRLMQDLSLLNRPRLASWIAAFERRERLWPELQGLPTNTRRLVHNDGTPLRCELLGEVACLSWFAPEDPGDEIFLDLKEFCQIIGARSWYLQHRLNRGASPNEQKIWLSDQPPPERWLAQENGVSYEFRRDSGLSPGLFLDQRANRLWVREHSAGRTVLNLFAYTGGFSVCAALGGAVKTVTVDISKSFLQWAKTNFALNSQGRTTDEFRSIDSRDYLAFTVKKQLKFDLIICDPPSFGRSKSGVFRIEKDLPELLSALGQILTVDGRILFATNYEHWTTLEFLAQVKAAAPHLVIEATPPADWDFELPDQASNMKSCFLRKF